MFYVGAFFATIVLGFAATLLDSNVGMGGNFGVIVAIAVMGAFILYAIDKRDKK